jgi:hypothetical protein
MRECRGNFSQKASISWERRGSENGQSFIILLGTQHTLKILIIFFTF